MAAEADEFEIMWLMVKEKSHKRWKKENEIDPSTSLAGSATRKSSSGIYRYDCYRW